MAAFDRSVVFGISVFWLISEDEKINNRLENSQETFYL